MSTYAYKSPSMIFGISGMHAQTFSMSVSSLPSSGCPNSRNRDLVATFSLKISSVVALFQSSALYFLPFLVDSLDVAIGPYNLPKICLEAFSSSVNGCIFNISFILTIYVALLFVKSLSQYIDIAIIDSDRSII